MPRPCAVESHPRRYQLRRHPPPLLQMPRPCAVESHARCYQLRRHIPPLLQMPRPCAVESHARCYKKHTDSPPDATALRRGVSRSLLQKAHRLSSRCHGLAPWSLTLAATKSTQTLFQMPRPCAVEPHARCYKKHTDSLPDATALRRGASRSLLQKAH